MSLTKNWLHDYSTALDDAWMALEDALAKVEALADLVWIDDDTIRYPVPAADVNLLQRRVRALKDSVAVVASAQEPSRLAPELPKISLKKS